MLYINVESLVPIESKNKITNSKINKQEDKRLKKKQNMWCA